MNVCLLFLQIIARDAKLILNLYEHSPGSKTPHKGRDIIVN